MAQRTIPILAEAAYARAASLESNGNASCVDQFFQAATLAWPDVAQQAGAAGQPCGRAAEVYHSALTKLISSGQRFSRLDPKRGLQIQTTVGCITVPTSYHGFLWQPDDFDHFIPVGEYSTKDIALQPAIARSLARRLTTRNCAICGSTKGGCRICWVNASSLRAWPID